MFPSFFMTKGTRARLVLISFLCIGFLIVAAVVFPLVSGARRQQNQQPSTVVRTQKVSRHPYKRGEVLVRYRSESIAKNRTGTQRMATKAGELLSGQVEDLGVTELVDGVRLVRVAPADTLKAVAALRSQPDVVYAEPNYILHATVTPNDPRFGSQPNMSRIGAPQAWNTQQGSRSVVVGVLDQGIDIDHEDLAANIWTNPSPGAISQITGDLHGYNFVDNNGTIFSHTDTEDHATHVAGIIGAVGNNSKGVAGVSWAVSLMSLKFLDQEGFGSTSDAIRACSYAAQMRQLWNTSNHTQGANLKVINASFGGAAFSQSFLDAITGLNTQGILFVAAAGNTSDEDTQEPDNDLVPHYPSNFNVANVIAVAATDDFDGLATQFSHFGATKVDLGAPGTNILSTTPHCSDPGPAPKPCNPTPPDVNAASTYSIFQGTSMSTPHVSGAAALLWSQNPNLTAQQVKNLLLHNGDVEPGLIDKTLTGRRLNVATSLNSLAENDNVAPGAVTNLHVNSQNGRTLNIGWTASGDDGAAGQASLYQLNFIDGGTNAVFPLKGVVPITSGAGQITSITIPFRHTSGSLQLLEFDNVGNAGTAVTIPISIPVSLGDPFTTSVGSAVALTTGGVPAGGDNGQGTNADDTYVDYLLPFAFPFKGSDVSSIVLSTNGSIYFSTPPPVRDDGTAGDASSSPEKLGSYQMIAGLWDDLDLRTASRADAGIYVTQLSGPNRIIFRWQGVPCNFDGVNCTGGDPVNFEIELRADGVIKTRYGAGNTNLFPTVGLGLGAPDGYTIPSHTFSNDLQKSLTNAQEITFTPRAPLVSTIAFTQATFNTTEASSGLNVAVKRTGDTGGVSTIDYATSDAAGALGCSTPSGNASSRCDYLTTVGKLTFAPGETDKTIVVPIVNDVFVEGAQTFTITLSNPSGALLGAQSTATLTINDDAGEGGVNPIDRPDFYVRQHYIDFLNREPDAGGLDFWSHEITVCGADTQCIEVKRINVSAAFFISTEFQETGYLVYRFYKAAFGNLPGAPVPIAFTNFLRDTQEIGRGVQVGGPNWESVLETNKQNYALAFVQSGEFQTLYGTKSATSFVDTLNANAGNVLSPTERSNLIALFGNTPNDLSKQAQVLRAVAEDDDLRTMETNKAFVLMQYFGYLRRSPNSAPDTDFGGYNFWLTKLNNFGGNFVAAEMVKAFITSDEYRHRFGS
jgi:subtilisin family serine protease